MIFLAGTAFAKVHKDCNVSQEAYQAFTQKYPAYYAMAWESKDDDDVAVFKAGHRKNYAFFQSDGTWVKTETNIPMSHDLPRIVNSAFKNSKYASWEITNIKKVETPDQVKYCIKVAQDAGPDGAVPTDGMQYFKLSFSPNGTLLDQEVAKN